MDLTNCVKIYKESLHKAETDIQTKCQTKALKDCVGHEYELHRKRMYETIGGFTVDKRKHLALFDVDQTIYTKEGELIAFEETKGHYLDSCFMDRAVFSFAKTVANYRSHAKVCPYLIIHSFTLYRHFRDKLDEMRMIVHPDIMDELDRKLIYTTLSTSDRLKKTLWFHKEDPERRPYTTQSDDDLIAKDIQFIQSLSVPTE